MDEASLQDVARAVVKGHAALVLVADAHARVVAANRAVERLSGWSEAELLGKEWFAVLLPPEDVDEARALFAASMRHEVDVTQLRHRLQKRWVTRSGEVRDIVWSATPVWDDEGNVRFLVGTGVDITEQLAGDRRLLQCLDAMAEGVCLLDAVRDEAGTIVDFVTRYLNPAGQKMAGDLRVGNRVHEALAAVGTQQLFSCYVDVVEGGPPMCRRVEVHGPTSVMSFELSAARLDDGAVVTFRDVTALRDAEERLAFAATHDPLTGLANRPLLIDRLEHALARRPGSAAGELAVVFVDLDGFKAVNDEHGHQVGDQTLVRVARAIEAVVRPADTVARFGGDEFVIVAAELGAANADALAKRLEVAVAEVAVGPLRLQASVGVAVAEPDDTADALLRRADGAMYERKRPR